MGNICVVSFKILLMSSDFKCVGFVFSAFNVVTVYQSFISVIFRNFLTGWGVVTVITGVFIFGQSTTIAVMELIHKF